MRVIVVAKLLCKPGQVESIDDPCRASPWNTREFAGCERTDVVRNEASGAYLLVKYWNQESS